MYMSKAQMLQIIVMLILAVIKRITRVLKHLKVTVKILRDFKQSYIICFK